MLRKTLLLVFASMLLSQAEALHTFSSRRIPDKYIVTLRHTDIKSQMRERLNALLDKFTGHHEIEYDYHDLGISGKLSPELIRAIEAELAGHVDIDNDHHINMHAANNASSSFPVAAALWGLDRVDQASLPLSRTYTPRALDGTGVTAYVVDTGVFNQREFETRVTGGYDAASNGATNPVDCNGHGTHVAGTIGSATYGIAKNVNIVGIKVLNCQGSGTSAGILNGLAYVARTAKLPAVVNMSLGGSTTVTNGKTNGAYANAFAALNAKNIPVVVAAGNEAANACGSTPANEARAITVGASTITDTMATFSNFGACVDIMAPGQNIQSTYLNAQVSVLSGTSMASPHVAGVVALMLQANPALTPAQVKAQLLATASLNKITGRNMATTRNALLQIPTTQAVTSPTPVASTSAAASASPSKAAAASATPTPSKAAGATPSPSPSKNAVASPTPSASTNPSDGKPTYPWLPGYYFDYLPWELVPDITDPYVPTRPKNLAVSQSSESEVTISFDVDSQTSVNCLSSVNSNSASSDSMCLNTVDHCGVDAETNVTKCAITSVVEYSGTYTFSVTSKSFEGGVSEASEGATLSLVSADNSASDVAKVAIGAASSVLAVIAGVFLM